MEKEKLKQGLSLQEVIELQQKFGKNELVKQKKQSFIKKILHTICEPMFLLLIIASVIYFILGEPRDGIIMLIFVIAVIGIDVIQEWKTDRTLAALKDLSAPHIRVIRDAKESTILSSDLVPGDIMIIEEGVKIPADGRVIKCNDLRVDESSLTGESEQVWKIDVTSPAATQDYWKKDYCYAGTLVTQGTGFIEVDKIGTNTEYGKIGDTIAKAPDLPTPLQKQTNKLVKICAIIAGILFLLVALFTFLNLSTYNFVDRIIQAILSGITLAMAMIPEEFPVVLTVFLSMGAWRLAKKQALVRRLTSVETLGAVSVLCTDKTGTITLNQMQVGKVWSLDTTQNFIKIMGMGCETEAYDPMEKAILEYCEKEGLSKEEIFSGTLVKEYTFTNETKMMGHIWQDATGLIRIAAKGAPESILAICSLSSEELQHIQSQANVMSGEGMRVLAVATKTFSSVEETPPQLTDCELSFCGLVGFIDPPRDTIKEDILKCNRAGVRVVMITGDNGLTAKAIAKQIGIKESENVLTGDDLNILSAEELREKVKHVNIFSRVIPEHKMKIVKAFQENGEIVAMTGDGVNDAAALKYADIGIAMGKRGSEVSAEAADLILLDDNFSSIVDTIQDGRRIYDNIRKAIGYIFAIHIPIALASLLAPLLGINPSYLFLLPLHIVLLELVIDPTCSIVLERQPAESDIMDRKPRDPKSNILTKHILLKSILQGFVIFVASFGTYLFVLQQNVENIALARTMGLCVLMISNLFLVIENSSELDSVFYCLKHLFKDKLLCIIFTIMLLGLLLIIYSPLNAILKLTALSFAQILIVILLSALAVFWYEIVKLGKH